MPELPSDEDLRRWENLAEAAHAGPWYVATENVREGMAHVASGEGLPSDIITCLVFSAQDAEFIAAACTAMPALLHLIAMERRDAAEHAEANAGLLRRLISDADEIRQLRTEVERLTGVNRRMATAHGNLIRNITNLRGTEEGQ